MLEIMQSVPFPNIYRSYEDDPSRSSMTSCSSPIGSIKSEKTAVSIKSDSGYESPADHKKPSRWIKMNEELLHKDVKKFLKKNGTHFKIPNDTCIRKSCQIFRESLDAIDSEEGNETIDKMLQELMMPKW